MLLNIAIVVLTALLVKLFQATGLVLVINALVIILLILTVWQGYALPHLVRLGYQQMDSQPQKETLKS